MCALLIILGAKNCKSCQLRLRFSVTLHAALSRV